MRNARGLITASTRAPGSITSRPPTLSMSFARLSGCSLISALSRDGDRSSCAPPAATDDSTISNVSRAIDRLCRCMAIPLSLSSDVHNETHGSTEVMNETEVEASVSAAPTERVDRRDQHVDGRPMNVVGDFHADPHAGRTKRYTQIGGDSDIHRKFRFDA